MSALGHSLPIEDARGISALPLTVDVRATARNRRQGPIGDIARWFEMKETADIEAPQKKSPSGAEGLEAGASDLRDENSSRDRQYKDQTANKVPSCPKNQAVPSMLYSPWRAVSST